MCDLCSVAQTCPEGQVWNECASACPATCDSTPTACILMCIPKCTCPGSAPILLDDKCISRDQCPGATPAPGRYCCQPYCRDDNPSHYNSITRTSVRLALQTYTFLLVATRSFRGASYRVVSSDAACRRRYVTTDALTRVLRQKQRRDNSGQSRGQRASDHHQQGNT